MASYTRVCRDPDNYCNYFSTQNDTMFYNSCVEVRANDELVSLEEAEICHILTTAMFVANYCSQLPAFNTSIWMCLEHFGIPAGLCLSYYQSINSRLFKECFDFFVENRKNESGADSLWETQNTVCASPNASYLSMCRTFNTIEVYVFNITWYCKTEVERTVYVYVIPVLSGIILASNIVMVVTIAKVFSGFAFKILFGCIAVVDILSPLFLSLVFVVTIAFDYYKDYMDFHLCILSALLLHIVAPLLHGVSVWLTVGLVLQRFIVVKYPFKVRASSEEHVKKFTISYIFSVFLLLFCIFIPQMKNLKAFQNVELMSKTNTDKGIHTAIVTSDMTRYRLGTNYILRLVFIQVIPVVLIVVFGSAFVISLIKQDRKQKTMASNLSSAARKGIINVLSSCIVAGVLLAEIPTTVFLCVLGVESLMDNDRFRDDENIDMYLCLLNMFTIFMYESNLIFCFLLSKDFRDKLCSFCRQE